MNLSRFVALFAVIAFLTTASPVWAVYHAGHGRWLQRDPAGFSDGSNVYAAFRGNPQRFHDAQGLACAAVGCPPSTAPGTPPTTSPASQPAESPDCRKYIDDCFKNEDVLRLLQQVKDACGRKPKPGDLRCGDCSSGCGEYSPPPPSDPDGLGSIRICQNRYNDPDRCPQGKTGCGTIIHELTHMIQWCTYRRTFKNPRQEWRNKDNCIVIEYLAYKAEGHSACSDNTTCCERACSSCKNRWPSNADQDACVERCIEIFAGGGPSSTLPWINSIAGGNHAALRGFTDSPQ